MTLPKNRSSLFILGDISGIQEYIFDVSESGGSQAKRFRARSFVIQALAEIAAAKVLQTIGWNRESEVFVSAGKFLLMGPGEEDDPRLENLRSEIQLWLRENFRGRIRFFLVFRSFKENVRESYRAVTKMLEQEKKRPWTFVLQKENKWLPHMLALPPLDEPCSICRIDTATETETEEEGILRNVCPWCKADRKIGAQLPKARWFLIHNEEKKGEFSLLGHSFSLSETPPKSGEVEEILAGAHVKDLKATEGIFPPEKRINRCLTFHIPTDENEKPIMFAELARKSRGNHLLGVLKADVDSLGPAINRHFQEGGLQKLGRFSRELDGFFTGWVAGEMERSPYNNIYSIFLGGDDLLLVGPWNVLFDFAGHIRDTFKNKTGNQYELTLSAGFALSKPNHPIKFAAKEADELLDIAKKGTKDQFATLGQVWKWEEHEAVISAAKQFSNWVDGGVCKRGWIQTFLRLAEMRRSPNLLATPRLNHFIARNLPRLDDRNPDKVAFRNYATKLLEHFDAMDIPEVLYLPAICRYVLTATSKPSEEGEEETT